MNQTSFQSTVKNTVHRYRVIFLQKFNYLREELILDPKGGFFCWLKSHKQKLALDDACIELLQEARKPDFQFDSVTNKLSQFILKKDDLGQAQWYQDAHRQLINCQKTLDGASVLKADMIKPALTELKFISEADQFHHYFNLQPLQRRVRDMYEAITERLDTLLELTKAKNQEHKSELDVREQEAKLKLAAELTRQHQVQLEQDEVELKKVEVEQQLIDQQLHADEASWSREAEARQLSLQESQEKHRQEIQQSISELELDAEHDGKERSTFISKDEIANASADQHLTALLKLIKSNELDRSDPKIKEQLQSLLQAIAGL